MASLYEKIKFFIVLVIAFKIANGVFQSLNSITEFTDSDITPFANPTTKSISIMVVIQYQVSSLRILCCSTTTLTSIRFRRSSLTNFFCYFFCVSFTDFASRMISISILVKFRDGFHFLTDDTLLRAALFDSTRRILNIYGEFRHDAILYAQQGKGQASHAWILSPIHSMQFTAMLLPRALYLCPSGQSDFPRHGISV